MAVDRGSLRYTILVEDKFTKPIRKFREELLKAKGTIDLVKGAATSFANIRTEIGKATVETRKYSQQSKQMAEDDRRTKAEQVRRLREIQAGTKQATANEKLRANLHKEIRAEEKKVAAEAVKAEKAKVSASKEALKAEKEAEKARSKALSQFGKLSDGGNKLLFTFRRLFGVLAAFTIARQAVGAFTGLIGAAIQFNRSVEDTEIGLAALFSTLGKVRNEQGKVVEGAEAFASAQGIARDQVNKLRLDALSTTATFEELSRAFTAAVSPGLAANLNLDEIRKLTTLISQAAATQPGLTQDQLPEEIRALLTPGAATSRTSRIFTALSISPEELKRAKEGGQLFQFLEKKLGPFALAADATQKSFTGLIARVNDAVGIAAGGASVTFFRELKDLLVQVGDAFIQVKRDANGVIESVTPNPQAVQTLAILFDSLREGVRTLREGISNVNLGQLQNAVAALAAGIRAAANVAVGFIDGLLRGFSDVAVLAQKVFGAFDSSILREAVSLFSRMGVLAAAVSVSLGAVLGTLKLILSPLFIIGGAMTKAWKGALILSTVLKKIPGALTLAAFGLPLLVIGFQQIAQEILGIEFGLRDLPEVIGLVVERAGSKFFAFIESIGTSLSVAFRKAIVTFVTEMDVAFLQVKTLLLDSLGALGSADAAAGAVNAEQAAVNARIKAAKEITALELELAEAKKITAQIDADSDKQAAARVLALEARIKETKAAIAANNLKLGIKPEIDTGFLQGMIKELNQLLNGALGGDIVNEKEISDKIAALVKELNDKFGKGSLEAKDKVEKQNEESLSNIRNATEAAISILQNMVQTFGAFAADVIVDAFDPNADTSLRERFAQFLQGLAKQIIQTIITLLVATAIAKAFGVPLPSDNSPPPSLVFAEGGPVPDKPAHGVARPSNIPASDTVAAWLTPGEYVQTAKAVAMYGLDVMNAIRSGAIDPMALKALAGAKNHRKVASGVRNVRGAYASGGIVTQTATKLSGEAAPTQQAPAVSIAAVVANDRAMERLLGGGKSATLQFMRENASAINGILSKDRR